MTQTVLVTGASSGIGRATALTLAERGLRVFGTSRRPDAAEPAPFPMLQLDVRSEDSVNACVNEVLARAGRVDVLVNNAGYALSGASEETSIEEAKAQFDTNFWGAVRMVNAVLPGMRKARAGKIISIGSVVGLFAIPFAPFYSASKFALEGYSEALWHELRPFGISVSVIEPAFIHTAIAEASSTAAIALPEYQGPRRRAAKNIMRYVSEGLPPDRVTSRVLEIIADRSPTLRYPVGTDATWLPRLKAIAPWSTFAAGVGRRFSRDVSA
jgi:NAD(P)-dependent dehydrogenase (short-subunit alcohol dehydrogenase family)